jgi:DNA-binding Xre family transcriptional regulator
MLQTYTDGMIKVRIQQVAQARGIQTAYQLQKAMDINPGMASRLWKGEFEMIGLKTLDRLCSVLDCEPNEILVRTPDKKGGKR